MRDWKFQLALQLAHGSWFLNLDHGMAGLPTIEKMLAPTGTIDEGKDQILSESKPLKLFAATADDYSISDSFDQLPAGSIATMKVSGSLFKYGTWCSYGTEEIMESMIEAANHKNIGALLFEGDSGGGGVNSVDPIRKGFAAFENLGKPTLALMDASFSAMYYGTARANHIMASNDISAGFGSIGIMYSYMDMTEYYKKLGIERVALYPEESSEKNLAFELAMDKKFDMIKTEELAPLARKFQSTMVADRGAKLKHLDDPKILKGKTYSAEDSVANGLADSIGDRAKAIETLQDLMVIQKFKNSKK